MDGPTEPGPDVQRYGHAFNQNTVMVRPGSVSGVNYGGPSMAPLAAAEQWSCPELFSRPELSVFCGLAGVDCREKFELEP